VIHGFSLNNLPEANLHSGSDEAATMAIIMNLRTLSTRAKASENFFEPPKTPSEAKAFLWIIKSF
jgi:hypothetical protein